MNSIWQEIEIEWQGKTYKIRPTIEFINHMEAKDGRSLMRIATRAEHRDLPSGLSCEILADTLKWVGVNVTAEQVFFETSGLSVDLILAVTDIIKACVPASKVSAAPAAKKPQARKRKA
jgi:hypothetical protein